MHVGAQFDQGLIVHRVREPAHVHLEGNLLEFVPAFDHRPEGRQPDHEPTVFPHGAYHHAQGHGEQVRSRNCGSTCTGRTFDDGTTTSTVDDILSLC